MGTFSEEIILAVLTLTSLLYGTLKEVVPVVTNSFLPFFLLDGPLSSWEANKKL